MIEHPGRHQTEHPPCSAAPPFKHPACYQATSKLSSQLSPVTMEVMITAMEAVRAVTSHQSPCEPSEQSPVTMAVMITASVVSLCWIAIIFKYQSIHNIEDKPVELRSARDVAVQGPVNYTRWRATPRFQPLGDAEWGAWPEGPARFL